MLYLKLLPLVLIKILTLFYIFCRSLTSSNFNFKDVLFEVPIRNELASFNRHYYTQALKYQVQDLYLPITCFRFPSHGLKVRFDKNFEILVLLPSEHMRLITIAIALKIQLFEKLRQLRLNFRQMLSLFWYLEAKAYSDLNKVDYCRFSQDILHVINTSSTLQFAINVESVSGFQERQQR